jgi:hypothetical protein
MSALEVISRDGGFGIAPPARASAFDPAWFDRPGWEAQGARRHTSTGRAPVLICEAGSETWVLRHYSRGGLVARLIEDHYLWHGLARFQRSLRKVAMETGTEFSPEQWRYVEAGYHSLVSR